MACYNVLSISFFILLCLAVNSYLLYPVIITVISYLKKEKTILDVSDQSLSILISAYNEEKSIEARLRNISEQDYDFSKVEVIVGSDCSDDKTNEILERLEKEISWLKVFLFTQRRGKAGVLNEIMEHAKNDILIFTDANTEFERDALKLLASGFTKMDIGGVSGRLVLTEKSLNKKDSVEEKKYWEYETFIKRAEGRLGVLVGANGGIFAIRKELVAKIPIKKAVTDDLFLSLAVLNKGYKFVYEPRAVGIEEVGKNVLIEFKRKIRFAATNFQTFLFFIDFLFKWRPLLSYAFISHKVTRWFFPFLMFFLFIINILLLPSGQFYFYCFILQVTFYLLAVLGFVFSLLRVRILLLSMPFFFAMANLALLVGFIRFLRKKHSVIWQTTER